VSRQLRRSIATAVLLTAAASSAPARAADPDPWFGKDKALHFAASGAIAAGGYTAGALLFDARGHALVLGASLALGAGIAKEALDLTGYGDPSWRDLTWDVIGTTTGVAAAWAIDLMIRGVSDGHPLLVAPRVGREGAGLFVLGRF
jgi:putative lipoprotein